METAIIYARVSTKGQADDELPIDGQLEQCRRKAEQLGATVMREFIDPGVSARSDRRDAFMEAVTYCRVHEIDYFVCWNTARFFRDHVKAPLYKVDLQKHGTNVVYASVEFDRKTNEGWLTESIYELFDELYSRQVSVDTMRGMIKNARDGHFNGGSVPFGYMVVESGKRKRLQVHEQESAIVREIFDSYLQGYGAKQLAMMLNDSGILRRGKTWDKATVTLLLKNEVYLGHIVFNRRDARNGRIRAREDWIITPSHPPIISQETFDQVQDAFGDRAPRLEGGSPHSSFVFTGILRCGACGGTLQTESATGRRRVYHYYNCRAAQKGAGCRHRRLPAGDLDTWLIDLLMTRLLSRENIEQVIRDLHLQAGEWIKDRARKRELVVGELRDVEGRLAKLYGVLELHGVDAPNLGDLSERIRALRDQRGKLERTLTELEDAPAPEISVTEADADELVGLFRSAVTSCDDPKLLRSFFGNFVQAITVGDADIEIRYHPDALVAVHSDQKWLPVRGLQRTASIADRLPERFRRVA